MIILGPFGSNKPLLKKKGNKNTLPVSFLTTQLLLFYINFRTSKALKKTHQDLSIDLGRSWMKLDRRVSAASEDHNRILKGGWWFP